MSLLVSYIMEEPHSFQPTNMAYWESSKPRMARCVCFGNIWYATYLTGDLCLTWVASWSANYFLANTFFHPPFLCYPPNLLSSCSLSGVWGKPGLCVCYSVKCHTIPEGSRVVWGQPFQDSSTHPLSPFSPGANKGCNWLPPVFTQEAPNHPPCLQATCFSVKACPDIWPNMSCEGLQQSKR